MGAFRYVTYRRWYAYVCGCVGAASNVGAGASVNIAPCCAGAPGFAPPVPGNFRYFRFLGGWGWGMPKKIGRLGLRESPWERVRERGFEWEREGRGKKAERRRRKKAGCGKGRARKSGAPLPQPVKPTRGRHPASSLQPQRVALVIRIVLGIIITEEIIGVRIAQRQTQRILQRRTRR